MYGGYVSCFPTLPPFPRNGLLSSFITLNSATFAILSDISSARHPPYPPYPPCLSAILPPSFRHFCHAFSPLPPCSGKICYNCDLYRRFPERDTSRQKLKHTKEHGALSSDAIRRAQKAAQSYAKREPTP